MRRSVALAAVLAVLALTACSSGNRNKSSSSGNAASSVPATGAQSGGTPAPLAGNAAIESRLQNTGLTDADVAPLTVNSKRPWNNHDFAMMQADPAAFEKMLNDGGRLSGALLQFLAPTAPTPGTAAPLGVLEILSTWKTENDAKAGLPEMLKTISTLSAQPNTATTKTDPADLGKIGDEVTASHITLTPVGGGQQSDAYVVGLRRGRDTALMVFTGTGGAPHLDEVKRLVQLQNSRLG